MNKEIKNFGKVIEVLLVILVFINLILLACIFAQVQVSDFYPQRAVVSFVQSSFFTPIVFIINGLIYLLSIFYVIDTIQEKKNVFLKLSFCLLSILTTVLCFTTLSNIIIGI